MWKITTRGFTLQEILIMAAMNVAPALIATDKGERTIGYTQRAARIHNYGGPPALLWRSRHGWRWPLVPRK